MLENLDLCLASPTWIGYDHLSLMIPHFDFWLSIKNWNKDEKNIHVLQVLIWILEADRISWLVFCILIKKQICKMVFYALILWLLAVYIDLKMQRTFMSIRSWFGAFEDASGSWQWFGILILIWTWSLFFNKPKFHILFLYLYFVGAKNIHVI